MERRKQRGGGFAVAHVALTNTGFGESAAYAASQVRVTHRIRTRRFISAPFSSRLPGDGVIERRGALSISQSQIKTMTQFLPFSRFHQLADLALHQVAFEAADVVDVKLAIQVIGFVKEGARQ